MQTDRRPYSANASQVNEELSLIAPNHVLLTQARLNSGLTLQQVADQSGINIRQYQKFESGERDFLGCSFSLGLSICQILNIEPTTFQKGESL